MSDNHRRYCAIKDALMRLCPHAKGNVTRHLHTLTALICGIVGSCKTQLPAIASKAPGNAKRQSRITRYERFLKNKTITVEQYYLPYVKKLLASVPPGPLVLVIDGSVVGRHCIALVISVLHNNRALPVCWSVVRGKKGHLPETLHQELVQKAHELIGAEREVILLGDGEFDGCDLQKALSEAGWGDVCRTAQNVSLYEARGCFSFADLCLQPGDYTQIEGVRFTKSLYGPLTVIAVWEAEQDEALYLVTNMELGEEALCYYRLRFAIETFFSDQKSRGFHLAHSHLSDPERLSRLMIASCLGYLWMVCLGVVVKKKGWLPRIHRTKRCDLSLFQIGLLWLEHSLNEGLPLWVAFELPTSRRL